MKRRDFLRATAALGMNLTVMPFAGYGDWQHQATEQTSELLKRTLGKTKEQLSIIGFGGILVRNMEQRVANNLVARANDHGINYFDVAPTYGNAQRQLGPALLPYRKNCFLACKTTERLKDAAEKELHESLTQLKTDYFDLYQLHALTTKDDVEQAFGAHGAMEVFVKAQQDGKIRFLGFSAHSEQAALLAMAQFDFDTILFPINFVCWYQGNFGAKVMARAKDKQMGVLAIKSLALAPIPKGATKPNPRLWYIPVTDDQVAQLALRFTLSQGTTAAIPPGDESLFWKAVAIAKHFTPLTDTENQQLTKIAEGTAPLFKSD